MHATVETSREALDKIEPYVPTLERKTYLAILAATNGMTRKELETSTGILTQTLCGRLYALEKRNRIAKARTLNGLPVKRDGCSVYVAVLVGPYLD